MIWRAADQFLDRLQNRVDVDRARKQAIANLDADIRQLILKRARITAKQKYLDALTPSAAVHSIKHVDEFCCTAVANNQVGVLRLYPAGH